MVLLSIVGASVGALGGRWARPAAAQDDVSAVNVELILDLSGSMAAVLPGGQTRMQAAKAVMTDVIAALPVREGVNVGFRIYGHEGSNSNEDRDESCQSSELVVPIQGVNKDALQREVDAAQPVGWTPLALSLERAGGDFQAGENVSNNIVMVTDGEETCGGDPCAQATALRQGAAAVTTHVVGFALTSQQQQLVNCIAQNGGGLNLSAANAQELADRLFLVLQEINVVVENGFLEIEEFGGIFPRATVTPVASGDQVEGGGTPVTFGDNNRIDLAVGIYTVSWSYDTGEQKTITVNIEAGRLTWIRGSLLKFPQGQGEIYEVRDLEGIAVFRAPFEQGDFIWVLPGIYRMELVERVGDPVLIFAEVQCLPGTATQLEIFTAGS